MIPAGLSYQDVSKRIKAAQEILSSSTTTLDKLSSLKTLLAGINPTVDAHLAELDKHVSTLGKIQGGDILTLTADALPEETEEQKRRKKIFILILKSWNDLKSEVARVQAEFQSQKNSPNQSRSLWARIFSATKGPLAIITIVAIGIAAMAATSVNITIENRGCGTLYANSSVPVSLPGLVLPSAPIPSGASATATIPPLSLTIDGTKTGVLTLSSLKLKFSIQLSSSVTDVTFDGASLLGKSTDVTLSDKDSHVLRLTCN